MTTFSGKKLYRAGKDHVVGGVCAGFADYFSIDVTLVRIIWLLLTLVNGIGAVIYLISLAIIPKNPEHENLPPHEQKKAENAGLFLGIALVAIGLSFALDNWVHFHFWNPHWFFFDFNWHIVWPICLILFGLWYIYYSSKKEQRAEAGENKHFYRSTSQRMIGGVCGGLAEFWSVDVTLVRIGYAVLTLVTAVWLGIVAYIVMMIVVKENTGMQPAMAGPIAPKPAATRPRAPKTPPEKTDEFEEEEHA